ncbi:endonuclease/exonuclease/phosphatase family protein [Solirubrobacter soli]|uniref:endonuclease/exonuclease/phosphatase family protein n=1 Tax=Solirubrobacter soli TaxID=363832 RepID=UPI000429E870|nr:endonuclease/exonuclease/phosphatase family protein [Solirubrobacter soli]
MSRSFVFACAAVVALCSPTAAQAASKGPTVTVMTRNLFLGADLSPAINAPTIPAAIDGAGTVWNELQSTNFAERVVPLAREIKASKADLVGLQEVALWRQQTPSDGGAKPISPLPGATPATAVEVDFLALLRAQLGSSYKVAVVQEEFDAELPVDADASDATGTGPLAASGADFDARLTMRDVILVRKGSKVKLGKTKVGHYKTRYEPNVGGITIPVDRGWTSVEARVGKRKFRFVNTHLEAFGDPRIRLAQANELTKGPLKTSEQVILVGDLNSGDEKDHEPEKPGDELAFAALTKFGMKNNGARQSCCYQNLFDPAQLFDHNVDHVLSKPGLKTIKASITGKDKAERTPSGLWPSDHGGVVSTVRLRG